MRITNKTCTLDEVAIYTSLQPIIHQFMTLQRKLGHTYPGIDTEVQKVDDSPSKKGTELESNCSELLSSIHHEKSLNTHQNFNTA